MILLTNNAEKAIAMLEKKLWWVRQDHRTVDGGGQAAETSEKTPVISKNFPIWCRIVIRELL
jgi:hypothetical protein